MLYIYFFGSLLFNNIELKTKDKMCPAQVSQTANNTAAHSIHQQQNTHTSKQHKEQNKFYNSNRLIALSTNKKVNNLKR